MVSILSLNIKGLASFHKQLSLQEFSSKLNSPIIFLQETNLSKDSPYISPNNFHLIINPPVQPCSGTVVAVKQELYNQCTLQAHKILVPGYLQAVKILISNKSYDFINVYLPHNNENAETVLIKIEEYITAADQHSCIVMAGDWNLTLYDQDRKNSCELRRQLVTQLKTVIELHNLADVWRIFNHNKNQFTYKGPQQHHPMSRLDRFYMKNQDLHLVSKTEIIPSFSDHYGVTLSLNTPTKMHAPAYWKLDPLILQVQEYQEIIKAILEYFDEKSLEENCQITSLWEKLKEEVKMASKRFSNTLKQNLNEKISTLEAQLSHIDNKTFSTPRDAEIAAQFQKQISNLYKANSTQKLQYFEAQIGREANIQSKYFLQMTKQAKPSAIITQLQVDGKLVTENLEIYQQVHQAFSNYFSDEDLEQIDPNNPIYENLSMLSAEETQSCERQITIEEIEEAVKQAKLNKAPGMDGLPVEFYKTFWPQIKNIFLKIVLHFQNTGQLPPSMKRTAIIPIPKNGDRTLLKNWRPICLINTDYKFISRVYSKRISSVVSSLLDSDQSYCVPGRTIYNNIHKIRNVIHQANLENSPLGILAVDQSGAFDKISHQYILYIMEKQGFGPQFCQNISALLKDTKGFVKMGSNILAPFIFKKGVKQGEPLAGMLYTISAEPFLKQIEKSGISGFKIPRSKITIRSTAFADDVNFFITNNEDFQKITQAFNTYSSQSGAKLNQQKSSGLFCGSWRQRSDTPFNCTWNNEGSKFLGVHLGNSQQYEDKNWEELLIRVNATLNKWTRYIKMTTYNGRKIIFNQLAGSQLIHTLTVLQPPTAFLQEIHKTATNFMWQRKHWLHPNHLYAPLDQGGLGLTNIEAKTFSLRLSLASHLINNLSSTEPEDLLHYHNMRLYGELSHQHFFSQEIHPIYLANLQTFYKSLFLAWNKLNPTPVISTISPAILKTTPLYGSRIIQQSQVNIIQDWKNLNYNTIQDFLQEDGQWKILNFKNVSTPTQRRLTTNYNQIKTFFNQKFAQQRRVQDNQIQYQIIEQKNKFLPSTKKFHYSASLNTIISKPEVTGKTPWLGKKINWLSIQCYPTEKKDADIVWRLLNNALVTPRKLFQWKIIPSPLCPWCPGEQGNDVHMFFKCDKTTPLWNFVTQKAKTISNLTSLTYEQALIGFPPTDPPARLTNYLLVLAKSTIYWSYMSVIKEATPHPPDYLAILRGRIRHRFLIEENYAKIKNTEQTFSSIFKINNAL